MKFEKFLTTPYLYIYLHPQQGTAILNTNEDVLLSASQPSQEGVLS